MEELQKLVESLTIAVGAIKEEVTASRQENQALGEKITELQQAKARAQEDLEEEDMELNSDTNSEDHMPVLSPYRKGSHKSEDISKYYKMPLPERFSGEGKNCRTFLTQCQIHFRSRPHLFETEEAKVMFVVSNLGGEALEWITPFMDSGAEIMNDYAKFEKAFKRMFERRFAQQAKNLEYLTLKQGSRELGSYITHFQQLSVELKWSKEAQMTIFQNGLKEELKDALVPVHPFPEEVEELIEVVLRLEQRLAERKTERRPVEFKRSYPYYPKTSTGTTPGSSLSDRRTGQMTETRKTTFESKVRGPLTAEERKRRMEGNLCLYCGQAGHAVRDCPLGSKKSGNAEARK